MASRRARRQGPRLFEAPVLFSRLRRDIAELVGLVWLAVEIAKLVRSKFAKAPAL